jgi:hypothetical protein
MGNYPDDIRSYDHDFRSPFHTEAGADNEEPRCDHCGNYVDECDCEELAPLTPSQQAKATGLKSLAEVTRVTGMPRSTLNDWHKDKPRCFEAILEGARVLIEREER